MEEAMKKLNEQDLLNVSGGLAREYADVTMQHADNVVVNRCKQLETKDECRREKRCSWDKKQSICK